MIHSISTPDAPAALGPYSQAVRHDTLLWCSGQLGINPSNNTFSGNDAASQTNQALINLSAVCREAGTSLSKAVKLTIYLADMNDFSAVNSTYEQFFEAPFPARACVEVARLPKDARVEIDATVAL